MMKYLLQTIPRGLEEITTILGLLGILLFLLSGHVKPRVKWTTVFLLLFTVFWRMEFNRFKGMSSRYIAGLIIPYLLLALYSFRQFIQKKAPIVKWCMAIMLVVMLLNYIKKDLKRNQREINFFAIAEIIKKSNVDKKEEVFLVPRKDFGRISFLSRTDNIIKDQRVFLPYRNNFERPYFPLIIDIDPDNVIVPDDSRNQICSFITNKDSKKRINLFRSEPIIHLEINPAMTSIDATKNILQNGAIEAIDSQQESHEKLVGNISNYRSSSENDEFARTPQNVFFAVTTETDQIPLLGIDSVNPIDGQHSVSIQLSDGAAYLVFIQHFSNGQYSYSFLVQGKRGTMVLPVYQPRIDGKGPTIPICLFTIPDSRTFQISCSFDIAGLKDNDFVRVGVQVQNGKALFDDFVLRQCKGN